LNINPNGFKISNNIKAGKMWNTLLFYCQIIDVLSKIKILDGIKHLSQIQMFKIIILTS